MLKKVKEMPLHILMFSMNCLLEVSGNDGGKEPFAFEIIFPPGLDETVETENAEKCAEPKLENLCLPLDCGKVSSKPNKKIQNLISIHNK